jgi:2-polyprenyl-3-methyl-5-hydroxy-6-metoxy-1,4-benzoquinol methylase
MMQTPSRSTFGVLAGGVAVALAILSGMSDAAAGQLASKPAAEWIARLERPERVAGLRVDDILGTLDLKPGMVVADIGAGPGIFSWPLAKAVAPGGKVYAVEVDQGFIDHMNGKLKAQPMDNLKPVLGKFTDPNLPSKDVDLAFFHDVLHHVDKRADYLKALAPYIKPTGRIVVIELDPVKGSHRDDPTLQVSREALDGWMGAIGFKPLKTITGVFTDDRWGVIYARN